MNQDQEFKQQIQANDAGEYFSEHNANIVLKNFKKLNDEVSDLREKNIKLRLELHTLRVKESEEQRFIRWIWNVYSRNVDDLIHDIMGATTYDTEGEAKDGKYALPKHCFDLIKRISEYTEKIYDGTYLDVEISVGVNNPDYYNQPSNSDVSMTQDVLTTIKTEGMFIVCQKCKGLIPPQAEKHIFNFCPACGRRIVRRI